ncbi:unnamed protein product [Caenorhabditis auriculariae]|uniref:gamma-butyrobetaine dioxygenase n=1 Tax=Caenorhabditis auriculariae TaxID=2777116 RepID=A0A8S1HIN2_9PELO|nr:unnamed protein product [Caenorhabditis auriculariae]
MSQDSFAHRKKKIRRKRSRDRFIFEKYGRTQLVGICTATPFATPWVSAEHMLSRALRSAVRLGSRLSSVSGPCPDRIVTVKWDDGGRGEFPLIWLRDTSPDAQTYTMSAAMKARNLTMNEFDVEQSAQKVWMDAEKDEVLVEWASGLLSRYPSEWLRLRNLSCEKAKSRRRQVYLFPETTWGKDEIEKRLKRFDHQKMMQDGKTLHDFLEAVCLDGIAVLEGASRGKRGAVEDIGKRIGLIRQTHFGIVFEVSTKADASNMAYASNGGLPFHTDFPSLSHPPELQMLHMLQSADEGGNSLFVDGFHVAELLRKEQPEVFETLTHYSMEFIEEGYDVHEIGAESRRFDYDMCARHKVIRTNDSEKSKKIYRAMKTFTDYCYQPRNVLKIRLNDGDTVLWANTRLLHTRDAFRNAPGKSRTLTGCYFDWDFIKSRVRFLRDEHQLPQNQPSA